MSDDGPGAREIAQRVFAAEFDDASLSYSESDEERAPNYVVMPTGARVNRLFVAGVLTEVERVNDETRRGRVVDPSGAFVTYAGQYQPEAQAFLERAEAPEFVALTGKARTFEPEDGDRVFTSVRPESLNEVDADTRDRWVVSAAEATLDRLAVFETALDSELRGEALRTALESGGAPASLAAGIPKAIEHYDTSTAYVEAIRRLAVDALELIAGERSEVRAPDFAPDSGGEASIGALPETDVTIEPPTEAVAEETATPEPAAAEESGVADEPATATGSDAAEELADASDTAGTEAATGSEVDTDPAPSTTVDADTGSESAVADADAGSEATGTATGTGGDELGDFDAGSEGSTADGSAADSAADDAAADDSAASKSAAADAAADVDLDTDAATEPASDEMYELDDAEREEIESEFGTDFSTGTEVDEPGEADIDVPDPEELSETPEAAGATGAGEEGSGDSADETGAADEADVADASTPDEPETDEDEGDEDVDLEAAAIEAMDALDDGDGADRDAVVETVVDDHGVAAEAVEDAIQDALMSGKCYEPGDGVLKPI